MTISDEELKSLTDAIRKRHGLDISSYEPHSLKRRVAKALHVFSMKSVHELWMKILHEHGFIYSFMGEVNVGVTAMFQDPILWRKIRKLITSGFFPDRELAIWHAGCSTGEEVFTMGIVLKEAPFQLPYRALATDMSSHAIQTAIKGNYPLARMTQYEANYKEYNPYGNIKRYFQIGDAGASMRPDLVHHVQYENHDLLGGSLGKKFDVIFFRNAITYFDDASKRQLFERFHDSLNDGGLLIVGFDETLLPLVDSTRYKVFDIDTRIFRKV